LRRIGKTSEPKWYEAGGAQGQVRVTGAANRGKVGHVHENAIFVNLPRAFHKPTSTHNRPRAVTHLSCWFGGHILKKVMGKLIRFPAVRARSVRRPAAGAFAAFGELEQLERQQRKLLAACFGTAVTLMAVLQLALG
jgi:hypothetical protein